MVSVEEDFDCENEAAKGVSLLPDGEYELIVESQELKANKAETGEVLHMKFQVIEGESKGKTIMEFFNWSNPNLTAVEMSRAKLGKLGVACGIKILKDTDELNNLPFRARIGTVETENKGKKYINNVIEEFIEPKKKGKAAAKKKSTAKKTTAKGKGGKASKPKAENGEAAPWVQPNV